MLMYVASKGRDPGWVEGFVPVWWVFAAKGSSLCSDSCGTNVQAMFIYLRESKECFEKVRGRHGSPVRGMLTGSSCPEEGRMWQLCRSMCTACWNLTVRVHSNKCVLRPSCHAMCTEGVAKERLEVEECKEGRPGYLSLGMRACLRISETWAPSSHLRRPHACVVPQPGLLLLNDLLPTCRIPVHLRRAGPKWTLSPLCMPLLLGILSIQKVSFNIIFKMLCK